MKQTEEYYYGKMPKDKQNVYRAMLHGLMELSDEFLIPQVPTTDGNWLYDVFFQLRLDHQEIFWAVGFKYRYYKDSPNLILIPEYIFDKNKIREHQKALGARVDKLVRTAMKFSEWDKEKYVHDFICENIRYDKLKKPYSHEIIGPLGHGVGVCEGIAKSVKVLCDALGVWCIIAICGNNPKKGIKYRHTWNIVRINGQYYHLDATFDNTLGKNEDGSTSIRYDYFNLDDKNIFRDHEPLIYKVCEDFTGEISASPVEGEFAAFFCGLEGTFVYVFQFGEGQLFLTVIKVVSIRAGRCRSDQWFMVTEDVFVIQIKIIVTDTG